jgi:chromosome segregation ATPase
VRFCYVDRVNPCWPDRKGTSDGADEVTLSRKGAKSRTDARSLRSTGTKAKTRVGRTRQPRTDLEKKLRALEKKLDARVGELVKARKHLAEALEQQTATSEVLQIISSSSGELEPVFNAMLENAVRLCEAKFGNLLLYEGTRFRRVALYNAPPACHLISHVVLCGMSIAV